MLYLKNLIAIFLKNQRAKCVLEDQNRARDCAVVVENWRGAIVNRYFQSVPAY